MSSVVRYECEQDIGIIVIDSPPVNALSSEVITGLQDALVQFQEDRSARALVVLCEGRTFVAGGDIAAFDNPDFSTQPYNHFLAELEAQDRPVIASLHGNVLGGGLELAIAGHFRIAHPETRLGFPEINIGVLPGSLGTQRLPRLVPVETALEMMVEGKPVSAKEAYSMGLVDALAESGNPREAGLSYAQVLIRGGVAVTRTSERPVRKEGIRPDCFATALSKVEQKHRAAPAARAIVECLQAAVEGTFEEGEQLEAKRFEECRQSRQSRALRHLFFAERESRRVPGIGTDASLRAIRKVGVIGAGTMGGGIAMNFANVGIPTTIVEAQQAALDRGIEAVRRNYASAVAKGRLSEEQLQNRMSCLHGTLSYDDLADCDLVIEAVFEDMALKCNIMQKLGKVCKPGAILATNTSTLNVDEIALASGRPADVVGTHFFSPANVMRLLEVVRGAETAPDVLLTTLELARRIGKIAVVSGVCYGFIGNRMAEPYMREAEFLLMEGASPAQIDSAVEDIERVGMAMGPCRMLDMAGIDVGAKTLIELGKAGGLPADASYRAVCQRLHADGWVGQKAGKGYYRYEGRAPQPHAELLDVCEALAKEHGIARRSDIDPQEIVERLMLPLINEDAKILEEGIALRPGDIDVVWTSGYGFPGHRGGPVWMADDWSTGYVVERLKHYGTVLGDTHGYWTPAPLLLRLAEAGKRLSEGV